MSKYNDFRNDSSNILVTSGYGSEDINGCIDRTIDEKRWYAGAGVGAGRKMKIVVVVVVGEVIMRVRKMKYWNRDSSAGYCQFTSLMIKAMYKALGI